MIIASFKQMHKEIGTKGIAFVVFINLAVCTSSYVIGYIFLRLCLKAFGLTM